MRAMKKTLLLSAVLTLFFGCANIEQAIKGEGNDGTVSKEDREAQFKMKMDGLLGRSKKEVVLELGPPEEIKSIAGLEILMYRKGNVLVQEKYNCYFDGDKMVKWDYAK
jgi:hypothetical protein